ncbi:MAG: DUF4428 domain-containing protein [Coriobacteriia bacterium]|nr:DUF4428 domain-containing protein [Coriobacteriia bacterium]
MGLFDKKNCDICGGKIGMLGNRKLEDGNLCKDCAKKLSPFFSDRRRSTVADIGQQLAYREANRHAVAAFSTTRTLGTGTKVLLDENAGKFMVTSARKLEEENPDVLDFSQVTGCNVDVSESRKELKQKDSEGNERSYNPPRYEFEYDFYCIIHVNAPYFDEIKFKLNNSTIRVEPPVTGSTFVTTGSATRVSPAAPVSRPAPVSAPPPAGKSAPAPAGKSAPPPPAGKSAPANIPPPSGKAVPVSTPAPQFVSGGQQILGNASEIGRQSVDYRECEALGEEIREALTKLRQDVRESAVAASIPKQAVTCPSCGASTVPDIQGRCEYCRGSLFG